MPKLRRSHCTVGPVGSLILVMILASTAFGADPLVFSVTVAGWSNAAGLNRLTSGTMTVTALDGTASEFSLDSDGGLIFEVPSDQGATWSLNVSG